MGALAWADPRVDGAGVWHLSPTRPQTRLTLLGIVVLCLVLGLLFLGVVHAGRVAMCATHKTSTGHGALRYCSDYVPVQR